MASWFDGSWHSPWQSSTAPQVCCQKLSQKVCDGMPLSVVTSHIQGRQVRSVVKGGWTKAMQMGQRKRNVVTYSYKLLHGCICNLFVWRALSGCSGQKSCSSPNIPLPKFARRALTASEMLPRRGGVDQPESSRQFQQFAVTDLILSRFHRVSSLSLHEWILSCWFDFQFVSDDFRWQVGSLHRSALVESISQWKHPLDHTMSQKGVWSYDMIWHKYVAVCNCKNMWLRVYRVPLHDWKMAWDFGEACQFFRDLFAESLQFQNTPRTRRRSRSNRRRYLVVLAPSLTRHWYDWIAGRNTYSISCQLCTIFWNIFGYTSGGHSLPMSAEHFDMPKVWDGLFLGTPWRHMIDDGL